jgi:uncharacterized membrane protein HdeD (DUF308 family)
MEETNEMNVSTWSSDSGTWGTLFFRGLLWLFFAFGLVLTPLGTATNLFLFFGAFLFADGIFSSVAAIGNAGAPYWTMQLIWGLLEFFIGAAAVAAPGVIGTGTTAGVASTAFSVLGATMLFIGITQMAALVSPMRSGANFFAGAIIGLFGILALIQSAVSAGAVVTITEVLIFIGALGILGVSLPIESRARYEARHEVRHARTTTAAARRRP